MRTFAAVLCMYWVSLWAQPMVYTIHPKKEQKQISCCVKKQVKETVPRDCSSSNSKNDCCGKDVCNPLFSQCPVCAPACIPQARIVAHINGFENYLKEKYPVCNEHFLSQYASDLLRPPQIA